MDFHLGAAILLTLFVLPCPIHAGFLPLSVPVPVDNVCNSTPYPYFCKGVLPGVGPRNIYDYGRFSLARSLSEAWRFSSVVDGYLSRSFSMTPAAVRAIQDCRLLAGLNVDFLQETGLTLNSTRNTGPLVDTQADQYEALLSAILTNQETCLDGLRDTASAWSVRDGLSATISDTSKLFSVSLSLFSRAWVPQRRAPRSHGFVPGGRLPWAGRFKPATRRNLLFHEIMGKLDRDGAGLPLRMSRPNREVYESRSGRRLLQSGGSTVQVNEMVVVSQDGTGNFTTINAAIAAAPNKTKAGSGYHVIYVVAGVYEEYISIPKNTKYLMMLGDGINKTIITGNRNNVDGWTTFNSATFAVVGEGFVMAYITVRNTAGAAKHQAVALRSGADLSSFYSCSFEGYQDTLYTHSLRQFYRECDIYGTVDFIFGNAAVVLQNCNVYSRLPMSGQSNTITAQGRTDPNQNTGTSLQNCSFLATPDLASAGSSVKTYLGRPWKLYSRTVIMQSYMDASINPAGWLPWDGTFALDTLYYAEYSNRGPGSSTANRVTWPGYHVIGATDAANFTVSSFLAGDSWLPPTGIPYLSGLTP